jgi:FkbH-like protein
VTCFQFPGKDPQAIYDLLVNLRDLFGKSGISEEDVLRLESVRSGAALRESGDDSVEGFSETLLERAESELTFSLRKDLNDRRALELINKTNQFNLNGRRFTEGGWQEYLEQQETFVLTASYRDRFGPLGKIGVVAGRRNGTVLSVESWVMSCRAFARRIEHQCLKFLFEWSNCGLIAFDYQLTPRNGPLKSFFTELVAGTIVPGVEVSREQFEAACPKLFHQVRELDDE